MEALMYFAIYPFKDRGLLFETQPNSKVFINYEVNALLEQTIRTNIGLIIRLTYYTGMGLGEIVTLTRDKIHLDNVPYIRIIEDNIKLKSQQYPIGQKITLTATEGLQEAHNKKRYLHSDLCYLKSYLGRFLLYYYKMTFASSWIT